MSRPTRDQWLLEVAHVTSKRATCARRKVGCVLADEQGRILSTGYNGPPRGFPHCTQENPCSGANAPSGQNLDLCEAVHAEQNALLQCPSADKVYTCYVTTSPCVTCVKLLLNTGCQRIVFANPYARPQYEAARELWSRGRIGEWVCLKLNHEEVL